MSPIFIFINGCLAASAIIFFIRRFRSRRRKKYETAAHKGTYKRRSFGETAFRKDAGQTNLVLHCPPAHFNGEGYDLSKALERESILFSITRNPTHAVKKDVEVQE